MVMSVKESMSFAAKYISSPINDELKDLKACLPQFTLGMRWPTTTASGSTSHLV
jgi:hypothetical protein